MQQSEPKVADNPEASRFEITVDGALAGFAEYRLSGPRISFTHTEIDPAFGGRGLGSTLVKAALDAARDAGLSVLPFCPFVQRYIERHPDYLDLVPADQRARFSLDGGEGSK
ncbi:N-acetyltransferase [Microbispora sp. SCL1-1]|uniref:N-acetyltransferase n=1 Tax=Microbispora hainanensis TaxID=568844 RepID=A0ABZ1SPX3_9ACTN|nr:MULTISPECIES: GNAT family N-acetyltransferase [Microbispora]NJP26207.1 N-acetyltransferase [Microbispora sp. CL1-1]TQS12694.1 N-acetyltransferase [Microbispora sp. SCL1-1]